MNDSDWKVRRDAVSKITDDNVLKDIFRNDSVLMVKISAANAIDDVDFLFDGGVFGAERQSAIIKHFLDYYNELKFIEDDGLVHNNWCTDAERDFIEFKLCKVLSGLGYEKHGFILTARNFRFMRLFIRRKTQSGDCIFAVFVPTRARKQSPTSTASIFANR